MKIFKKLFYVLILLVVVSGIAITSLTIFIDPNKLKPVIAAEASKQTGYIVNIQGKLSWSIYPRLGIKSERITITQPGEKGAFADLQNVLIVTDLMQLFNGEKPLQGNVYVSTLKLLNLQLSNVHAGLSWKNEILTIKPFSGKLYSGSFKGEASGQRLSQVPRWNWTIEFNNIQLKPLLQDMNKGESKINIAGIAQVKMQASTQGNTKEQLLNYLNGQLQFSMTKGVVEGMDLNYFIKTADAIINKQMLPMPEGNQTQFDNLSGVAIIKNGVANTENLLLQADAFTARGQGDLNIISQALDYHIQLSPFQSNKSKWAIPVVVTGNLQNPVVKLDAASLQVLVGKEKLDKVKTKVEKEIKRLPVHADKLIKKLLGE